MEFNIDVSAVNINTQAADIDGNIRKINNALEQAEERDVIIMPELCVSGYSCEDIFFAADFVERCEKAIQEKLVKTPVNCLFCIGAPIRVDGQLYNCTIILQGKSNAGQESDIVAIVPKTNLANTGVHYEKRWFSAWPESEIRTIQYAGKNTIPFGDIVIESSDGLRIGFEICEDAWVPDRPARRLYQRNVDLILNPSASHFAINKQSVRRDFIREASRAFGSAYVYTNLLGCESGTTIFDGGSIAASEGAIIGESQRLSMDPYCLSKYRINIDQNRQLRILKGYCHNTDARNSVVQCSFFSANQKENAKETAQYNNKVFETTDENAQILSALTLALYDWMNSTNTSGFVVSLSGGCDSSLTAALVWAMNQRINKKAGIKSNRKSLNKILTTINQPSEYSSNKSIKYSDFLASEMGSCHAEAPIKGLIEQFQRSSESAGKTIKANSVTEQNLQARTRSILPWVMANENNQLLLATGNMSEIAVGYMTMDGDTAGVLAPIGGIRKTRVITLLELLSEGVTLSDGTFLLLDSMEPILNQKPSAELQDPSLSQNDAEDLMPYEILDAIIDNRVMRSMGFEQTLRRVYSEKGLGFSENEIRDWITKFDQLYQRNQWKRYRSAPAFHIEGGSLDTKNHSRMPVLFKKQF